MTLKPNYWYYAGGVQPDDFPFTEPKNSEDQCGWSQYGKATASIDYINHNIAPQNQAMTVVKPETLILNTYAQLKINAEQECAYYKNRPPNEIVKWTGFDRQPVMVKQVLQSCDAKIKTYEKTIKTVKENLRQVYP